MLVPTGRNSKIRFFERLETADLKLFFFVINKNLFFSFLEYIQYTQKKVFFQNACQSFHYNEQHQNLCNYHYVNCVRNPPKIEQMHMV
jgi:hypothetical protein